MTHDSGAQGGGLHDRIVEVLEDMALTVSPQEVVALLAAQGDAALSLSARDLQVAALVAGCVRGDPVARRDFEARFITPTEPALRALGLDDAAVADIVQRVRVKLFVAEAGQSLPVTGYLGKGDLRAFVKVVATRLALSERRAQRPQVGDEGLVNMARGVTPQLEVVAAHDRALLREAVERAAAGLAPEERVALKLSYVDGLTVDEIGLAFDVHRATAARRVARARARLVHAVRQELKARLAVGSLELESALRDVDSQVDLSLSRILQS